MERRHTSLTHRTLFRMHTVRSLRALSSITLAFSFSITPLAAALAQTTTDNPMTSEGSAAQTAPTPSDTYPAPAIDTTAVEHAVTNDQNTIKKDTTATDAAVAPSDATDKNSEDTTPKAPGKKSPVTMATMSTAGDFSPQTDKATTRASVAPKVDQSSGILSYAYPIDVPPGRNGLAPTVALTYRSLDYRLNRPLGYGWSLSIPYIERINKRGTDNLYTDSSFNSSLDGELVCVDATTYVPRTQEGEFRKYQFVNGVWTVTAADGTRHTFGQDAASRQDDPGDGTRVLRWMIAVRSSHPMMKPKKPAYGRSSISKKEQRRFAERQKSTNILDKQDGH